MDQAVAILRALARDGRWRKPLALAIVFAIGCALLSWWQFARRAETAHANALVVANYNAEPRPLGDVLHGLCGYSPDQEWMQVQVTGTYLVRDQLLVRDRQLGDNPGFEVLTPLRLPDGDVFVIDRLSIGGSLAFFTQTGDNGLDGVLFSPRVGYTFELSKLVTFWPRGGLTYMKIEDSSLFGLTLEPMFVLWPRPNWGVLLGPTLDFEFIGSNGGDSERSEFSIGIPSVGLIASF